MRSQAVPTRLWNLFVVALLSLALLCNIMPVNAFGALAQQAQAETAVEAASEDDGDFATSAAEESAVDESPVAQDDSDEQAEEASEGKAASADGEGAGEEAAASADEGSTEEVEIAAVDTPRVSKKAAPRKAAAASGDPFRINGTCYDTLKAALDAANKLGTATIEVLGDYTTSAADQWAKVESGRKVTLKAADGLSEAPVIKTGVSSEWGAVITVENSGASLSVEGIVFDGNGGVSFNANGEEIGDGVKTASIITVTNGAALSLKDTVVRNYRSSNNYSAINLSSSNTSISLENVTASKCVNGRGNGGFLRLDNDNRVGKFENVTVEDCRAGGNGGGIYVGECVGERVGQNAAIEVKNLTVKNCVAGGTGGGVYFYQNNNISFTGTTTVENNKAADGGGLYLGINSDITFADTVYIRNNTATGDGGGILFGDTQTTHFTGTAIIEGNSAKNGGGLYIGLHSEVDLGANTSITNNTATDNGGGIMICNHGATVKLQGDTTINGNQGASGCSDNLHFNDEFASSHDDGTKLVVTGELRGTVGVYAMTNRNEVPSDGNNGKCDYEEGANFAQTSAADSSSVSGLENLVNDRVPGLYGVATNHGNTCRIMWSYTPPVPFIVVSKAVSGPAPSDALYTFELTLPAGTSASTVTAEGPSTLARDDSGSAISFMLKAGESVTFKGVASGTQVTIVETSSGSNYETTSQASGFASASASGKSVSGQVQNGSNTAAFTNAYTARKSANIVVHKSFVDKDNNPVALEDGQFEFQLRDASDRVVKTARNAADGTVTFQDAVTFTSDDFASATALTRDYRVVEVVPSGAGTQTVGNTTYQNVKDGVSYTTEALSVHVTAHYDASNAQEPITIDAPTFGEPTKTLSVRFESTGNGKGKLVGTAENISASEVTFTGANGVPAVAPATIDNGSFESAEIDFGSTATGSYTYTATAGGVSATVTVQVTAGTRATAPAVISYSFDSNSSGDSKRVTITASLDSTYTNSYGYSLDVNGPVGDIFYGGQSQTVTVNVDKWYSDESRVFKVIEKTQYDFDRNGSVVSVVYNINTPSASSGGSVSTPATVEQTAAVDGVVAGSTTGTLTNVKLDDPEPETVTLTVRKVVEGTYADKTKAFQFCIDIPDDATPLASGTSEGVSLNDDKTFELKDGQQITFENIPADTRVNVVEKAYAGYTVGIEASKTDESSASSVPTDNTARTARVTLASGSATITYTNTCTYVPPTGLADTVGPWSMLVLLGFAGLGAFGTLWLLRRRKVARSK